MQRTIIVEGPDGAGKSTLVEFLSRGLGRPVRHTGGPRNSLAEAEEALRLVEDRPGGLFDRCPHISNPIYCEVEGRELHLTRADYRRRLIELEPLVIYCALTNSVKMLKGMARYKKAHKSDEHLAMVESNHYKIVDLYRRDMESYEGKFPIIHYAYDQDDPHLVLNLIREIQTEGDN